VSDTVVFLPEKYTMPATASSDRATAAIEELTEALKNPAAAKPFLDTENKLNEAIAALTEMSEMPKINQTSDKSSVTVSPKVTGQRTTTNPVRKRNMTPQMPVIPRLANITPLNPRLNRHGGTRGISSTVSLDSFNSTNNIKKGTISSRNRTNNIIDTQREENSPQNAPIRSPITDQNINDNNNVNISNTQREENSPQNAPIRRKLRTRAKQIKQAHKMYTTVYRIFCDDGGLHQG
jgi:hypothetical protein